jgi:hypothetical protein
MKHHALSAFLFLSLAVASANAADTPLVSHTNSWRFHKGTNAPQASWQTISDASLNATWSTGNGGFGYASNVAETNNCKTLLTDMQNLYTTFYVRQVFTVTNAINTNDHISLAMDWDDGFVAYLDGTEIQRRFAPGSVGIEPAYTTNASGTHESSNGNSTPQPVETYDLGAVGSRLSPGAHVLAIVGLNESTNSSDFVLIPDLAYGPQVCAANTICNDTTWTLAGSPYLITNSLTIAANVTLTIDPGVEVQFTNASILAVRGRIVAEGNATNRIRFTHPPSVANKWGSIGITNNGFAQVRFSYVDFDGLGTGSRCISVDSAALYIDHCLFTNSSVQYITLQNASFIVQDSILPSIPAQVELITGHVIPADGYGIVQRNYFGSPSGGVQDVIDFTGGQRPGPIFQVYDNVFDQSVDDMLDLDGTDADIEGNIFVNGIDRNGDVGDTASAISGGSDSGHTSRVMVARNLFYNCSHGLLCKEGNFYTIVNNTFVGMKESVVNFGEPLRGVAGGAGAIFSGNIVLDAPLLFENYTNGVMKLLVDHCVLPTNWPGDANIVANPLLVNSTPPTNSWFTLTNDFRLQINSPAIAAGPNGLDIGGLVPAGASISGEPASPATNGSATLKISGPAMVAYFWRTNGGAWSGLVPLTNTFAYNTNMFADAVPITLSNLADGAYTVYVAGMNSAGIIENTNVSRTWTAQLDTDGDGMPDAWETANGTNPLINDANVDADGDGLSNLQEYWAGTNPNNSSSVLRFNSISSQGGNLLLSFDAISNRSYNIENRLALESGSWTNLVAIPSAVSNRTLLITNSLPPENFRFYRLVAHPE